MPRVMLHETIKFQQLAMQQYFRERLTPFKTAVCDRVFCELEHQNGCGVKIFDFGSTIRSVISLRTQT